MKQITPAEFLDRMHPATHAAIAGAIRTTHATHVVLMECHDFSSSHLGERTALCVGPECTYTLESIKGHHLHDLPSMRQYPAAYCEATPDLLAMLDATRYTPPPPPAIPLPPPCATPDQATIARLTPMAKRAAAHLHMWDNATPVIVSIGSGRHATHYPAATFTRNDRTELYVVGSRPPMHQKLFREANGKPWFIAYYMCEPIPEKYAHAHPLGATFGMMDVSEFKTGRGRALSITPIE